MKIALVKSPNTGNEVRGVGFYTSRLLAALKEATGKDSKINVELVNYHHDKDFDVWHFTYFDPFSSILLKKLERPVIVTVHDLIPLVFPKHFSAGIRGRINLEKQKRVLKHAAKIIVDSRASKKDVVRLTGINQDKIQVVYLAADKVFGPIEDKKQLEKIRQKYNLPQKFILYVGDINWNKNLLTLLLARKKINIPLVIVGKQAKEIELLREKTKQIANGPRDFLRKLLNKSHPQLGHLDLLVKEFQQEGVRRLGFVSNEDLSSIYNLASVYCQPSFYEGFGLPVLEAMACGCPVVSSHGGSLREICGKAAIKINPDSAEDITEKIKQVLEMNENERKNLVRKGFSQAKKFSWEKTSRETIKIYEQVNGD